jgi:peptidyl-prolyl cis-trans isomerase C
MIRSYLRSNTINFKSVNHTRLVFVVFLGALLACVGCREKSPSPTDTNTPQGETPTPAAPSASDSVAATVNGVEIAEKEIQALIQPELDRIAETAKQLPPQLVEQYKKQREQEALERLIVQQLLDAKVKEANIEVSEEQVMQRIAEIAASLDPPMSVEGLKERLQSHGRDFEQMKEQVRRGIAYEELMRPQWAGKINVTDQDAKAYYAKNKENYQTPEQVRASHILIKPDTDDPNIDPNQAKARAEAKTRELREQIKEGADFGELAKADSDDSLSASNGGDLGFFSRGEMEVPFDKAAFALEVGQVSDVVETSYGYHIIKVTDHKDASVVPFEDVKDDIMDRLKQERRAEFIRSYIESLKAEADIVYPPKEEPEAR